MKDDYREIEAKLESAIIQNRQLVKELTIANIEIEHYKEVLEDIWNNVVNENNSSEDLRGWVEVEAREALLVEGSLRCEKCDCARGGADCNWLVPEHLHFESTEKARKKVKEMEFLRWAVDASAEFNSLDNDVKLMIEEALTKNSKFRKARDFKNKED